MRSVAIVPQQQRTNIIINACAEVYGILYARSKTRGANADPIIETASNTSENTSLDPKTAIPNAIRVTHKVVNLRKMYESYTF